MRVILRILQENIVSKAIDYNRFLRGSFLQEQPNTTKKPSSLMTV